MSSSAVEFKDAGNKSFQARKYDEAIELYGKAISKNDSDPSFYTNRALCYMHLKKWNLAAQDCRNALLLDSNNVKANYFIGKILYHQNKLEEAIVCLTRAQEAANSQKLAFGDEITSLVRQVRRDRFRIEEEKRITQEIELQSYLNELIERDVEARVAQLMDGSEGQKDESVAGKIEEIKVEATSRKQELNSMFAQIDDRRRKRDIPDYLCGKISFELLRDPVVTPSGITYDRADIKEHLSKVGRFDPITREPLTVDQLIPNLAMKEVIDDFIMNNDWALSI